MRIGIDAPLGALDSDFGQQFDGTSARLPLVHGEMRANGLDDLLADAIKRIETGQRILEDHTDALAADRAHGLARETVNALAIEADLASSHAAWWLQ